MDLRTVTLASALAFGLAAPGAMAQQSAGNKDSADAKSNMSIVTQEKLRGSLEKAGFTNIQFVDAKYMVRAQSEDGDEVVMYFNSPPLMSGSGTGSDGSKSDSGMSPGSDSGAGMPETERSGSDASETNQK